MASMKQDLLGLKYSSNFLIEGMQEADIDLNLNPTSETSASIHGTVTDGLPPLPNATVKIFDSKGMPYKHTLTDENGNYSMDGIPSGTYSVGAVQSGYRLSDAAGVTLSDNDSTQINLTCTTDSTLSLGAIAGILNIGDHNDEKNIPLAGAKITLFDSNGDVAAATYTVEDGEFAFYDIADGKYTLLSSADGYLPASPMTVTITDGSIANINMSMIVDSRTYNGTVSGIIRDNNGHAVAGCFVGLYQVEEGKDGKTNESLVSTTKTNAAGKYLFGSVLGGNYLVKAKLNKYAKTYVACHQAKYFTYLVDWK